MADEMCPDCECLIMTPRDIAARLRRMYDQALDAGRNAERHYRTGTGGVERLSDIHIQALDAFRMFAADLAVDVAAACSCRPPQEESTRDIGDDADDDHGLDDLVDLAEDEDAA